MNSKYKSFAEKVRSNADQYTGMSNSFVGEIGREICINPENRFKGVYASDQIPSALAKSSQKNINIIVNLSTSNQIGSGHFVSIHLTPTAVFYIDPFGRPCFQPHVRAFLETCKKPIMYNSKQIQNYKSKFCGLYAILFCAMFDDDYPINLQFDSGGKKSNDDKCVRYIQKIIEING